MAPSIGEIMRDEGIEPTQMKGAVLRLKEGRTVCGGQEVVVGYVKVPKERHKVVVRTGQPDAGVCLTIKNDADAYEPGIRGREDIEY